VEDHPIEYETFEGIIPKVSTAAARSWFGIKAPIMFTATAVEIIARGQTSSRSGRREKAKGEWTLVRIAAAMGKRIRVDHENGRKRKPAREEG